MNEPENPAPSAHQHIFDAIRVVVDELCRRPEASNFLESIKASDLSCSWVEYYEANDGLRGYRAIIEETASSGARLDQVPECRKRTLSQLRQACEWISNQLSAHGLPDVEIVALG
jgi:hypothetical protein